MELFVYSDESGVLDHRFNDIYTFGGVIFTSKESRGDAVRSYKGAEGKIRLAEGIPSDAEVKASSITVESKRKLFRAVSCFEKFGIVIRQKELHKNIFDSKKTKQRYLDWAYKISLKNCLLSLHKRGVIALPEIQAIHIYADEHTTATDGLYELRESLEQEFRYGMFNPTYVKHYAPITPNVRSVSLQYCDSSGTPLIRAADIIANRFYHDAISGSDMNYQNTSLSHHPS